MIRAAQAIRSGQPGKAIDLLQIPAPYERNNTEVRYLRGLAYVGLGKGPDAVLEFQRIIDGKGSYLFNEIYSSVSLVGLARAEALSGDTAKARRAYEDFFNFWKDADPDVPLLIAARKEYQKLR